MSAIVTIYDESPTGQELRKINIRLVSEQLTVRELIEGRVRQEVEQFNTTQPDVFQGLVSPTEAEETLNGHRLRKPKLINADKQVAKAIQAFGSNGFFLLVDEHQAESLDESITFTADTRVSFIKLVPLVGG